MKINEYIRQNWPVLPKSGFNETSVVIIREISKSDGGWGHHSYEGVGVTEDGGFVWCYSSGCSCGGEASVSSGADTPTVKIFDINGKEWDVDDIDPLTVNYAELVVEYNDY